MEEPQNKPPDTNFHQLRLQGFQISNNPLILIVLNLIIGLVFIIVGAIIINESDKLYYHSVRYDDVCVQINPRNYCELNISLQDKMSSPIFIYMQVDNMYQNHRNYYDSRNIKQLMGHDQDHDKVKDSCDPVTEMKDLDRFYNRTQFSPTDLAYPCGLIARSWNNDTYLLSTSQSPDQYIPILRDDIAWKVDKEKKFKNNSDRDLQWLDIEDEFFINWMSTAGLPNFQKLYGRITNDLESGDYVLRVNNSNLQSAYSVDDFNGQKYFVITEVGTFGGKQAFVGILYIIAAPFFLMGSGILLYNYLHDRKERNNNR